MNPECLQAQQIISEAYDGALVAPAEMQKVKSHCASCAECAAFVSGLAGLRDVAAVQPPEAVLAATMAAVRLEVERLDAERTAQTAKTATGISFAAATGETAGAGVEETMTVAVLPRRSGRGTLAWVGAAATIVLVAVFGTVQGIRYMTGTPAAETALSSKTGTIAEDATVPYGFDAAESDEFADESRILSADALVDVRFIVFGGFVYEVAKYPRSRPTGDPAGEIRSDLGTGDIRSHEVYSTRDSGTIVISIENGDAYEARLVTRSYDGATFALQAGSLETFGSWPALPAGFDTPTAKDGSPSFERAGTDAAGASIFVPAGRTPAEGFAIAPNPSTRDPVAGSPNWTWWTPYVE